MFMLILCNFFSGRNSVYEHGNNEPFTITQMQDEHRGDISRMMDGT